MKLDIVAEIWGITKESIIATDRDTVAENLVAILIDHDYSPADIKKAFRDDYDVATALKYHMDDVSAFEDEEESEYEEYEDEEDNYDDEWD